MLLLPLLRGGDCTVTLSADGDDNHIKPDDTSISINTLPRTSMPPSEIQRITRAGQHVNTFAVGDLFPIRLDGTVGICDVTGDWYTCLIGIDHNPGIEGTNTLHFQFPYDKTGKGLAFVDSEYEKGEGNTAGFRINLINSNVGGWISCYLKEIIMPIFYQVISLELRNIIKSVDKYRDNVGGGKDDPTYLSILSSEIWLLAEFEIHGVRYYANTSEQNFQKLYAYYSNNGSEARAKYKHNRKSEYAIWWNSSVFSTNSTFWNYVYSPGSSYGVTSPNRSEGVVPCFAVA